MVGQQDTKFSSFYSIRKFITVFTKFFTRPRFVPDISSPSLPPTQFQSFQLRQVLPAHYVYDYGNIIHRSSDCVIRAKDRLEKGTAYLSGVYRESRQKEAKLNLADVCHLKP